jgi:hypothetical protein
MRKLVLTLAALAALGIAMPYAALADTVVIHKHKHRHPLVNEVLPHHHHNGKTVIIKHNDN